MFLMADSLEDRLRRIIELATIVVLAGMTLSLFVFHGPDGVPPILLLFDVAAIAAAAIPWRRLPSNAFALTGILGIVAVGFLAPPIDVMMRQRLLMLSVLVGAGAVSPRAGLLVGAAGTIVALLPLGRADVFELIATAGGVLTVAIVVPALVAAARVRVAREPIAPSALSDYVAVLAHELSTPIISVGASAQVLAKELDGRDAQRKALAIAEEARQVYGLLESLSDLSALESGRLRLSIRSVDINALVRASASGVDAPAHHVVVDVPDEPIMVAADDRRIRQVIGNLIGNAAKYSAAGTQIEVRVGLCSDRTCALVQVRDHGPGIPPGERARIFDKFARLSTAGGTRGSGLGLHISRAIVFDHGGEIWGEWPAGGGSIFAFTIPLATRSLAASTPRAEALAG